MTSINAFKAYLESRKASLSVFNFRQSTPCLLWRLGLVTVPILRVVERLSELCPNTCSVLNGERQLVALGQGFLRSADGREQQRRTNCFSSKVSKVSRSWGHCQAEQKDFTDFLFVSWLNRSGWFSSALPPPTSSKLKWRSRNERLGPRPVLVRGPVGLWQWWSRWRPGCLPFQVLLGQHRSTALQGLPVPKRVLSWKSHHQSHQLSRQESMLLVHAY